MTSPMRTVLLAAVMVITVACSPRPADTAAEAATIMAGANAWFERHNASDADGVLALYAEDALVMPANAAAIKGRAALREFLVADIAASRAAGITSRGDEVTDGAVDGNTAWISGTYSVSDRSGATVDTGKYVSVYRRTDNGWLITRDIWNSDALPVAASTVFVTAQVKDSAKWEAAFRTHADLFKSQTVQNPIRFATSDKNEVAIRMDVTDLDKFFSIIDSPATAEAMAVDGVKRETARFTVLDKTFELN